MEGGYRRPRRAFATAQICRGSDAFALRSVLKNSHRADLRERTRNGRVQVLVCGRNGDACLATRRMVEAARLLSWGRGGWSGTLGRSCRANRWRRKGRLSAATWPGRSAVALRRIIKLLSEAGAGPEHIVRLTWYLTSHSEYEAAGPGIGAAWRETLGRNFPPSTLLYIAGLVDERAKVEIEVTAFLPRA